MTNDKDLSVKEDGYQKLADFPLTAEPLAEWLLRFTEGLCTHFKTIETQLHEHPDFIFQVRCNGVDGTPNGHVIKETYLTKKMISIDYSSKRPFNTNMVWQFSAHVLNYLVKHPQTVFNELELWVKRPKE